MNPELEKILKLSYDFAGIERDIYYPERARPENDAEHSFQLCMLGWQIIEMDKLLLDQAKVFKLCLAHDLVEVHAGDVPLWGKTGHDEKAERERQALELLKEKFSNPSDIPDAIAEYKERKTLEAIFVYALDKLNPFLNQLMTDGKVWKANNVTAEQVFAKLDSQAVICDSLKKYFDAGIEVLKANPERFFI